MLKTRKQNRKTSVKPENKAENKTKPTGNKKKIKCCAHNAVVYSCAYNSFTAEFPVSKRIRQQITVKIWVPHVFTLGLHVIFSLLQKDSFFNGDDHQAIKTVEVSPGPRELTRAKFPNQLQQVLSSQICPDRQLSSPGGIAKKPIFQGDPKPRSCLSPQMRYC